MRLHIKKIGILTLLLIAFALPVTAVELPKKVLIVDIPRLLYSDLTSGYASLAKLAKGSAAGIMALPNFEARTLDKIYLELNSGNQLKAAGEGFTFLQVKENYKGMRASDLYRTLTGINPPRQGGVNIGLPKLVQLNAADGSDQSIGLLGKILHAHSFKTALIGNADLSKANLGHFTMDDSDKNSVNLGRSGSILLMDEKGIIDYASIGSETVASDRKFVFGIKTNTHQIISAWEKFSGQAGVTHIILGDLERINEFESYLPTPRLEYHRRRALRHIDAILEQLLKKVDLSRTLVVVLSLAGPDEAETGAKLNPVLIKSPQLKPGFLYSNSTRRAALVTGYDVIATILDYLGISNSLYSKGRNLTSIPGRWQDLPTLQQKLTINYDVRWPILTIYGYLMILLVAAFIIGMIFWSGHFQFFKWIENIYLFLLTIPAVFLGESLFDPVDWVPITIFSLAAAGLITYTAMRIAKNDHFRAFTLISLITVLAIVVDGLTNGQAELRSFWGYSAVAGVRFYGIGNEYMGFLLGAYIVMVTALLNKEGWPKKWDRYLWVSTGLIAVLLAHPGLGSNIGGGITALLGLSVTNYLWLKRPIRLREILILLGSFLVFILVIGCWDLSLNGKVTHFGQFLKILYDEGFPAFGQMIARKLEMNLELIEFTPLSKILIAAILIIPILYKKPPKWFQKWLEKYHTSARSFIGLSLTAFIALLANDSGIVSVATMFIFGLNIIMLLVIDEKFQGVERS